jgi:endonuclease/exonuclease/phosphatase family metal-dependent hydrolase
MIDSGSSAAVDVDQVGGDQPTAADHERAALVHEAVAYHLEPEHDDGRPARAWEVHAAEIERQAQEWHRIRELHPDVPVVVAGDFNQARSGRRWSYGTDAARQRPTAGLASVDFADVLVPEGRFGCDELLHQVDAFLVVEHRHVDATGA